MCVCVCVCVCVCSKIKLRASLEKSFYYEEYSKGKTYLFPQKLHQIQGEQWQD